MYRETTSCIRLDVRCRMLQMHWFSLHFLPLLYCWAQLLLWIFSMLQLCDGFQFELWVGAFYECCFLRFGAVVGVPNIALICLMLLPYFHVVFLLYHFLLLLPEYFFVHLLTVLFVAGSGPMVLCIKWEGAFQTVFLCYEVTCLKRRPVGLRLRLLALVFLLRPDDIFIT